MSNILLFPKILATFRSKKEEKEDGNEKRTMSPKRWILLLVFYISYLMFGASIYYHIEHNLEKEQRAEDLKERIEINEYILDQLADKNVTTQNEVLEKITDYCGKPVTDYNNDEYEVPYTWTFYHAFFFAFTVCSTVGYGNISPTTTLGRMIMIVYSVIGIPVNGILFAGLGEYFSKTFQAIYRRYKKYKVSNDDHYVPPQLGLITIVGIALVPGITLFLLLPAWIFSYFEKWPYSLAFYYSYVTTTTIGFGDYVPTFGPNQPREFGGWFVVYQIFIIFWFVFSLGYLLMIMTFITRGLQSKKLAYLEQQLSTNIKATQNRIWNGVTKDVGYLRRILNELYILKFKPVYTEPDFSHLLHRSMSCPELSMYRVEPPPIPSRKRAFSECYDVIEAREDGAPLPWVHAASETELDKFDRTKSFETAEAFRQTTGLLAKVVTALATVQAPTDDDDTIGSAGMYGGYHGLSDSQILASEWSFPGTNELPPRRGRACSDFNINPKWQGRRPTSVQHNEWTWSGDNDQIQEAINKRHRQNNSENLYRSSFGLPSQDYIVNMEEDESKKPSRAKKFSIPDGFRKLFPFKKRPSEELIAGAEPVANGGRKFSVMSVPETQESASTSYAQNGKPLPTTANLFPSVSMQSRLNGNANARRGSVLDSDQATLNSMAATTSYQRNAAAISRKRRESIFAQNPAQTARRASMFPTTSAAGLSQRRGSTFNTERRGSTTSNAAIAPRRGSLYPASSRLPASNDRRPSLFSVTSEQDLDVLENTTLADLIRALEVMHTQAVMDEAASTSAAGSSGGLGGIFRSDKKKRKVGSAGLEPPDLPPILSLFSGDNTKALSTTAANRLYARRSTIVGTLPSTSFGTNQASGTSANVLTRRRPSSVQIVEPPPSYSEKDPKPTLPDKSSAVAKFKRRFSIRPTALQIPPGKAPPPGVNINSVLQQSGSGGSQMPSTAPQSALASQTALQRRLSLRPSPLARELNTSSTQVGGSSSEVTATSPTGAPSSNARLPPLPPGLAPRPSNTTSSTHSPLSRIAQITQAQRKSSMPDAPKKPDA